LASPPRVYAWVDDPRDDYLELRLLWRGKPEGVYRLRLLRRAEDGVYYVIGEADSPRDPGDVEVTVRGHVGGDVAEVEALDEGAILVRGRVEVEPEQCTAYEAEGDVTVYVDGRPHPFISRRWVACTRFEVEGDTVVHYHVVGDTVLRRHDVRVAAEGFGVIWEGVVEDAAPFRVKRREAGALTCENVYGPAGAEATLRFVAAETGVLTVRDHNDVVVAVTVVEEPGPVRVDVTLPEEPGTYVWTAELDGSTCRLEVVVTEAGAQPASELRVYVIKYERSGANGVDAVCIA